MDDVHGFGYVLRTLFQFFLIGIMIGFFLTAVYVDINGRPPGYDNTQNQKTPYQKFIGTCLLMSLILVVLLLAGAFDHIF